MTLHTTGRNLQTKTNLAIVHWTCESTRWIMRHENSCDIFEEADWYGNRSVSVLPRNRKFSDGRNSLRVPDRARFRASAWFTWL